ncbi:MAG: primosomal protein N' [Alphaproteobacteria bacterium]|nr:primosomal protein N' [Alphaproteobacteria bacterium]
MSKIVGVMLPLPFNDVFDYRASDDVKIGDVVRVPFGKSIEIGVVFKSEKISDLDEKKIKNILGVLPYCLKPSLLKFVEWVAKYNLAYIGLVLKMVLCAKGAFDDPKMHILYKLTGKTLQEAKLKNSDARWHVIDLLKHAPYSKAEIMTGAGVSAGVIKTLIDAGILEPVSVQRPKEKQNLCFQGIEVQLTEEQQNAADYLIKAQETGFNVTLIDGVTGSGKTEVYLQAAVNVLKKGKQVLILVPEIALTTQWLERFEKRFGVKPYQWHSALTPSERRETWQAVIENRAKVLVGARSALFLPYTNLGLIVVDESHDQTFKQEDMVNYQARDMAIVRAKLENIPIVLSTATPDLETIVNVEEGKYNTVVLKNRYAAATLPEIKIVDLKKDRPKKGDWGASWLSPSLCEALKENLEKGEQSMLFLNRRGYAPLMICRDCGNRLQCPNCTSWLTEHRSRDKLICHHCGYMMSTPKYCPECGSQDGLTACGPGVERIAEEVKFRFPLAKAEILSSDTTSSFKAISEVISKMERKEIDILIGTQILAKGHHFPMLTLVGIVDADLGLMGSDLRASEQTFQLLSQVSGRAGRGDKKGMVYLQTLYPENAVLKAIVENNRNAFVTIEKKSRQMLNLPPFGKLAALIVSSTNENLSEKCAYHLAKIAPHMAGVSLLGPAPAPIYMLRGKFRYRLLLKTLKTINIQGVIQSWLKNLNLPSNVRVEVDIDPYSFM